MTEQRVLITAGASGIGWAIAEAFLADGARVHIADIDAEAVRARVATHERLTGSVGDVSQADDVEQIFEDVRTNLGGLDVLVSNAGISGPTIPSDELSFADWNRVVEINLHGTFLITRGAIPLLKEAGAGRIIIMSSVAGRFGYPNRIAYSTTKWGLVGLAKTLSMELGGLGITTNTIHPGAVAGPRIESVLQGRAEAKGTTLEDERAGALSNQAVQQFVDPADIGQLALFLAGPSASSISGQMFPIDGDSKSSQ